ncbi:MAG: hypothetical protein WC588_02740 [Candidatus Micrarchaeia archaeon]
MLSIETDRGSYSAGSAVKVTVRLRLGKRTKARGIYVRLACRERKLVKTSVVMDRYDHDRDREMSIPYSSHMETRTEERTRVFFEQEKKICGEGEFLEGDYEVSFALPKNAPPTSHEFGHDNLIHIWKVSAKLDVPFALDWNAEKEIFVEGL